MTSGFLIWAHSDHFDFVKWKKVVFVSHDGEHFFEKRQFLRVWARFFENFLETRSFSVYDNVFLKKFLKNNHVCVFEHMFFEKFSENNHCCVCVWARFCLNIFLKQKLVLLVVSTFFENLIRQKTMFIVFEHVFRKLISKKNDRDLGHEGLGHEYRKTHTL